MEASIHWWHSCLLWQPCTILDIHLAISILSLWNMRYSNYNHGNKIVGTLDTIFIWSSPWRQIKITLIWVKCWKSRQMTPPPHLPSIQDHKWFLIWTCPVGQFFCKSCLTKAKSDYPGQHSNLIVKAWLWTSDNIILINITWGKLN